MSDETQALCFLAGVLPGLAIDLWYDGGDWVALESNVAGGRRLRYELI